MPINDGWGGRLSDTFGGNSSTPSGNPSTSPGGQGWTNSGISGGNWNNAPGSGNYGPPGKFPGGYATPYLKQALPPIQPPPTQPPPQPPGFGPFQGFPQPQTLAPAVPPTLAPVVSSLLGQLFGSPEIDPLGGLPPDYTNDPVYTPGTEDAPYGVPGLDAPQPEDAKYSVPGLIGDFSYVPGQSTVPMNNPDGLSDYRASLPNMPGMLGMNNPYNYGTDGFNGLGDYAGKLYSDRVPQSRW